MSKAGIHISDKDLRKIVWALTWRAAAFLLMLAGAAFAGFKLGQWL